MDRRSKNFCQIPSQVITPQSGYPITGVVNQQWDELTGRAAVNWTPKLDFTDSTLIYGSYARGYKAGGANPPGAVLNIGSPNAPSILQPVHPLTFKPEFINAFELGSKNTLLDGALTLNGDVFYYDYENYQISEIVDRTSINLNFNAKVKGAEIEGTLGTTTRLAIQFRRRVRRYQNCKRPKPNRSHGPYRRCKSSGLDGGQTVRDANL